MLHNVLPSFSLNTLLDSYEISKTFREAEKLSEKAQIPMQSIHLLLGILSFNNQAQTFLLDRGISPERIMRFLVAEDTESDDTIGLIQERMQTITERMGSETSECMHLLVAMMRTQSCLAYQLMKRSDISVESLRSVALNYMSGSLPRRFRNQIETSQTPVVLHEIKEKQVLTKDLFEPLTKNIENTHQNTETKLEQMAPTLASCSNNLTEQARQGYLDALIGRDRELMTLIDVLGKRRANNPLLIGAPGVGKTAIVEGFAYKIAKLHPDVARFNHCEVASLDTGALVAGTSLRGSFNERIGAIKNEVAMAERQIIVFIDEIHTLIGAGSTGDGPQDAVNELKAALARGEFPCIGATTLDEYKKYIEKDPALERRFTPILIEEPSEEEALRIVEGSISSYAEHHQVHYSFDSLNAAIKLTKRYVQDRHLPDKAFAALDLAGSRVSRHHRRRVEMSDISEVVHSWTGIPIERLKEEENERLFFMQEELEHKIVGHRTAIERITSALKRGFSGFHGKRPLASLLFAGSTGVGKTELAKQCAHILFGREDAMFRIDMSEMSEKHSVARLLGAQPGYVGYEEGGWLTESIRRRPFQIVVFDDIDKAHPDVMNILLQILDEGFLTDSKGRRVQFNNTVIILTTHLHLEKIKNPSKNIGFSKNTSNNHDEFINEEIAKMIAPDILARLDEKIIFHPLTKKEMTNILRKQLEALTVSMRKTRQIELEFGASVVDFLIHHGAYEPKTGARGIRQTLARYIDTPLADKIISGSLKAGEHWIIHIDDSSQSLIWNQSKSSHKSKSA